MDRMIFFVCLLTCWPLLTAGQLELQLEDCYEMAYAHNPQSGQKPLLEASTALHMENIRKGRLPQVDLLARGQVQSENISLNIPIPGVEGVDLPIYNARTYLEGSYLLYDGGLQKAQSRVEEAKLQAELQSVEVSLYSLREQVNESFFNILLLQQRTALLESVMQDLAVREKNVAAAVRHGVALESDLSRIQVEQIKMQAQIEEVRGNITGSFQVLEALIGQDVDPQTLLLAPPLEDFQFEDKLARPELQLFDKQKEQVLARGELIDAARRPKLNLFAQGGAGYPNPLNFFDENLSPYGILGVNFKWNLVDWGKARRDKDLLSLQARQIENQRQTFEYRIETVEGRFISQKNTLENLIGQYGEIARLQQEITEKYEAQLENGVLSTNDYLIQVNEELQTLLQLQIYEVQLQKLKVTYLTHKGLL